MAHGDSTASVSGGDLEPFEQVGPYTLIREIGAGGMGVVYEARQHNPRRVVAVKLLKKGLDNPLAIDRFRREANVLGRLQHPNIAQVYEAGVATWQGRVVPYYAMEYISGGRTLSAYLREGKHSLHERLGLLIDLCSAVHHGHTRGVLHRDLKPANVLIDAENRLKLIDFGVARVLADVDNPLQTSGDAVIGTLQYMSPEQVSGDVHSIDARSDLYSLGVMAWELLTGKLPYEVGSRTVVQAAHLICTQEPPALRTDEAEADEVLEPVLRRALAKHREERYATVADFGTDFRHVLNGEPTSRIPLTGGSASKPGADWLESRRIRTLVCVAVGVIAGVAAAHPVLMEVFPGPTVQRWMSELAMATRDGSMSKQLMVVGVEDNPPILETAKELGLISPDTVPGPGRKPIRAMYGALVSKLAECRASVIALDLMFNGSSADDEKLAEGLQRARQLGVAVVAGMNRWDADPISPAVAANVFQLGGVTGTASDGAGIWTQDLAVRHASRPLMPSLALIAAMAKLEHGSYKIDVALKAGNSELEVMLYEPNPSLPSGRLYRDRTWTFPIHQLAVLPGDNMSLGLPQGSEVLVYPIDLPSETERRQAYLSAADVLKIPPAELTKKVVGKVIVVANFGTNGERTHTTPDGRALPDAYIQVMAIDALLGTEPVHPAGIGLIAMGTLASATAGVRSVDTRRRRSALSKVALLVVAAVGIGVACVALLLVWRVQINPVPLVIALLAAAGLMTLIRLRSSGPATLVIPRTA